MRNAGKYWTPEHGWGVRVPEDLEAELLNAFYDGAESKYLNFLLYDMIHPPASWLEGATPGDEDWQQAYADCTLDSEGWQLFGYLMEL